MTQYQPYPGGAQMPPAPQSVPPPPSVLNAVKLMYAGAVLSALSAIIGLVTVGAVRTAVRHARPGLSTSAVNAAVGVAVASIVIVGAIGIALWLWMAAMNKRGRNWARITGTVFFGIDTLGLIVSFREHTAMFSKLVGVLVWLVGLGAVILLWQSASGAFFNSQQR